MKLSAIVLAAGAARRFGRPKQLERWPTENDPTLVERVVNLASESGVNEVIVVTGNQAEEVAALFHAQETYNVPVYPVFNPRWGEGQGYSVAAGVQALLHDVDAALFFLSDQPRLKAATAQALLRAFKPGEKAIIFLTYQGKRGNPVLFSKDFFPALAALEGDVGGRAVVKENPGAVTEIPVDDPAILEDVDTPEDLANLGQS
jgi:molybdenum cofactor cytidylyltransferase